MFRRTYILLLAGTFLATLAQGKVFFGDWAPPSSLCEFWLPIKQNWWNPDDNSNIFNYCKAFATHSSPQKLLPDIFSDLKQHPSVERTFVYSMLVLNWDRSTTLPMLNTYYKSPDPGFRKIASDFIADIEEDPKGF